MARVEGIRERIHNPLFDSWIMGQPGVKCAETIEMRLGSSQIIRFFSDVARKSRLETNLQSSGVLPSRNSFEVRAIRLVAAGLDANQLAWLIYNSVVTLIIGDKCALELPTFLIPSGAGVVSTSTVSHGVPDPMATFRLAEPVIIDSHQSFRAELSFPHGLVRPFSQARGQDENGASVTDDERIVTQPVRVVLVLDGYLTRDAQ